MLLIFLLLLLRLLLPETPAMKPCESQETHHSREEEEE